jgi:hypothetical protein
MNKITFSYQDHCPICNKKSLPIIQLPKYPITELYVEWTSEFIDNGLLDQALYFCEVCSHAHLEKILDVRFIYQNYVTTSAASQGAIDCLLSFKRFIDRHVLATNYKLIIDIGGNDSSFLSYFRDSNLRLVNVDPNATGEDRYEMVRCFLEDIDLKDYKNISKKIIVSSHTIEHLAQPSELIRKISESLNVDDYCFLQFPSIESLLNKMRFDQICHQHLNYFSLTSISKLLNNYELNVHDHEYDDTHYGTLRVMVSKKKNILKKTIDDMIEVSNFSKNHHHFSEYYRQLNVVISSNVNDVAGFGAGLMVPTLAYYLPIISSLKYIHDDNPDKHGKRFINLPPKIVPSTILNPLDSVLITSISTKSAARAIYKKLVSLKVKQIILPTIFG